jgi:phasin
VKRPVNRGIDTFFLEPMFGWTREFASTGFNIASPHIIEAVQQTAEQHLALTRALYQKIEAVGHDSTEMLRTTCAVVTDTVTALNTKLLEAGRANSDATLDYAQKLLGVRSLSELAEVSTTHGRKQLELWAEQARELSALSQTATKAVVEPMKNGATKAMKAAA